MIIEIKDIEFEKNQEFSMVMLNADSYPHGGLFRVGRSILLVSHDPIKQVQEIGFAPEFEKFAISTIQIYSATNNIKYIVDDSKTSITQ